MKKNFLLSIGIGVLGIAPLTTVISCSEDNGTIAFFKSTDNSAYDEKLFELAEKYANELGYSVESISSSGNNATELTNVQTAIQSHKYVGAIFQPVDTKTSLAALEELVKNDIKTVVVDRIFEDKKIEDLDDQYEKNVVAQITSDNEAIAYEAAETLLNYLIVNNDNISEPEDINGQTIILIEGEPGSASSEERKTGFKEYFTDNELDPKYVELTGNWSATEAQGVFDKQIGSNIENAGVGVFAFNDQMADGVITSTSNINMLSDIDYPIVTVDATAKYKDEIGYDATDVKSRVIANYAQRSETTMYFSVYALIYSFDPGSVEETVLKSVLDGQIEWTIPEEQTSYNSTKQTLRLPGIAVTRNKDGSLNNESALIE